MPRVQAMRLTFFKSQAHPMVEWWLEQAPSGGWDWCVSNVPQAGDWALIQTFMGVDQDAIDAWIESRFDPEASDDSSYIGDRMENLAHAAVCELLDIIRPGWRESFRGGKGNQ